MSMITASIFLVKGDVRIFIPLPVPAWLYLILFIIISAFAFRNKADEIRQDNPVGGALFGLLVATLLSPSIISHSPALYAGILGLLVATLFYMSSDRDPLSSVKLFKGSTNSTRTTPMASRYGTETTKNFNTNELLDKISRTGINSLTIEEQQFLEKRSKRRKK